MIFFDQTKMNIWMAFNLRANWFNLSFQVGEKQKTWKKAIISWTIERLLFF